MRFFSYDPDSGLELHATAEAARARAEANLETYRDCASDSGWDEMVTGICHGEITGHVLEVERKPWAEHLVEQGGDPEDAEGPHPFDEFVDYDLRPIEPGDPS